MLTGDLGAQRDALRRAGEALAIAERLDLTDLRIHALTTIGSARFHTGDIDGRRELELAIEIARSAGSPLLAGALNNLAVVLDTTDLWRAWRELQRESLCEEAERFGDANLMRFVRGNLVPIHWILGDWDEAVAAADDFIAECRAGITAHPGKGTAACSGPTSSWHAVSRDEVLEGLRARGRARTGSPGWDPQSPSFRR